MNKAKSFKIILFLFLTLLFLSVLSYGAVPQLLNYQGTLTDSSGTPVPDGQYGVVFNIYDVATGGTPLWTETWNSSTSPVTAIKGNFNAMLGAYNPIPASFFDQHPTTYLGIKVGNDSEMLPRQRITSVAYAFTAGGGGIPTGAIVMWSGATDQIPAGWALCDGQNGTPDLRDRFIVGAGSGYAVGATGGDAVSNISHTHAGFIHDHGISNDGSHTHTYSGTTGSDSDHTTVDGSNDTDTVSEAGHHHSFSGTTSSATSHAHGGFTTNAGNGQTGPGGPAAFDNRPPYYALAFIIKL